MGCVPAAVLVVGILLTPRAPTVGRLPAVEGSAAFSGGAIRQEQAASSEAPAGGQEQGPAAQTSSGSADQLPVSVERIRKGLEATPPPPLIRSGLLFKVEVHGRDFVFPDFKDSLRFRREPIPPGGIYHYEFLRMVNPPEFQATPLVSYGFDPAIIVHAIRQAWHDAAERRAREEVQRELEALKKANEDSARKQ